MKQNPPRILTISKPYVAKAYRNKLTELAHLFSNCFKDAEEAMPKGVHGGVLGSPRTFPSRPTGPRIGSKLFVVSRY
ncbi:hypothetical protein E3A20_28590, partial [Planctomyces bekefii]